MYQAAEVMYQEATTMYQKAEAMNPEAKAEYSRGRSHVSERAGEMYIGINTSYSHVGPIGLLHSSLRGGPIDSGSKQLHTIALSLQPRSRCSDTGKCRRLPPRNFPQDAFCSCPRLSPSVSNGREGITSR
jgi:hypothetical protein